MAQYGHNFYGSSYYGDTNAFSGAYITKQIWTREALKGTFTVNIDCTLPYFRYTPTSGPETTLNEEDWTYNGTGDYWQAMGPSKTVQSIITCSQLYILFRSDASSPTVVNVQVTTHVAGSDTDPVTNYSFSANTGGTNESNSFLISGLDYGRQTIVITTDAATPTDAHFQYMGINAQVTDITIETRSNPSGTWTDFVYCTETRTITDDATHRYTISATSPNYNTGNYIQARIWIASSDNTTTPKIFTLETIAGDTSNRTPAGGWTGVFDMSAVASEQSTTFKDIEGIYWNEDKPDGTENIIRSSASSDGIAYGPVTVPYRQNTFRLRLKATAQDGYIDTPLLAPERSQNFLKTLNWINWDDESYLPPDSATTYIRYSFLNTNKSNVSQPFYMVNNPMSFGDKSLASLGNRDFYIRVYIHRRIDKSSPVVDFINLYANMNYTEEKMIDNLNWAATNNNNTGKDIIFDDATLTYGPPPEVTSPIYTLDDRTARPNDIFLYWDSEKDLPIKTNNTLNHGDHIWAETKPYDSSTKTGCVKHYQYGGGDIRFPETRYITVSPSFTPSLDQNLLYRYFLEGGWPSEQAIVRSGDTFASIAEDHDADLTELQALNPNPLVDNQGNLLASQTIQIPNHTLNGNVGLQWKSNAGNLTDQSNHNAVINGDVDQSSDSVQASIVDAQSYGYVDWVSEEKIYSGIINPNDVRMEYKRIEITPDSGVSATSSYVVKEGDTYLDIADNFGIDETDLRIINDALDESAPVVGTNLTIPGRILLPSIDPKVILDPEPYQVDVIYHSVVKTNDNTVLPESSIVLDGLSTTYKNRVVTKEPVIRSAMANGKDLLNNPMVTQITEITSEDEITQYNPWNETNQTGDFKLTDNCVDWSPTINGAAEPAADATYLVSYICQVPDTVTIQMDTTYQEKGGVDHIWRSPEVKVFTGTCNPEQDYKVELPAFSGWQGADTIGLKELAYVVEDSDLWVKMHVEQEDDKYYVVGSLEGLTPKDNWLPTIHTGYYYLGKDEYYLYSEPIVYTPTEEDMPTASNISYVQGKYNNGALVQGASTNQVKNSGFDGPQKTSTVFKVVFTEATPSDIYMQNGDIYYKSPINNIDIDNINVDVNGDVYYSEDTKNGYLYEDGDGNLNARSES